MNSEIQLTTTIIELIILVKPVTTNNLNGKIKCERDTHKKLILTYVRSRKYR